MSIAGVERLIWTLHRRGGGDQYRKDPAAYLVDEQANLDLTDGESAMVLAADYQGLTDAGVHPMAVLFLSQVNRLPMPFYLQSIGADPDRVAEFRRLFEEMEANK